MNRVMVLIGRFFVRLWHTHRNQLIVMAHKKMGEALAMRKEMLEGLPKEYRDGVVEGDVVLREARDMAYKLSVFFKEVGVNYEK